MRTAGAALLLLLVTATLWAPSHPHSANSTGSRRRGRPWTRDELKLAGVVAGEEYEEETATVPAGGGCSLCRFREEMKTLSLESIKEQILAKLGIEHPPNTTGRSLPKVPSIVLEKYRRGGLPVQGMLGDEPVLTPFSELSEDEDDFHARTEKVIVFAQRSNHSHPRLRHNKRRGQDVLFFRFSEKLNSRIIEKAMLWVHVRGGGDVGQGSGPTVVGAPVTISVLRVLRSPDGTDTPLSNIVSVKVSRKNDSEGSWVALDVRKLLELWLQAPSDNLGLVLQASGPPDPLGRTLVATDLTEDDGALVPFLEVYVADDHRHRTKRTSGYIGDCPESSEETRCCRYPLTVDFESFGWDWIIAPKKYEANYCSGECPMVFLQRYPHTYLAEQARRPSGGPGPCCAPRKLSAISMLYFDPQYNIIYGLLPGMVVDRCGCS